MPGMVSRLIPSLLDQGSSLLVKTQLKPATVQPREGNLWQAGRDGDVRGGQAGIRHSTYTAGTLNPALTVVLLSAGVAAGIAA